MPAIVTSSKIEDCLRDILSREGYALSAKRGHGERGVDILATRDGDAYYIEVIAYKSAGPTRARDFYEAFFRAVSRLNQGARHCVMALSHQWEYGLPRRAEHHYDAWLRIADAFPELETWIINVSEQTYRRVPWYEWIPLPKGVKTVTLSEETLGTLNDTD
jgi:hypothetical protein